MKLKRYVAPSLPEAVEAVRRELGPDAVLLQVRRVRGRGWRLLFRRFDQVEVTVAWEEAAARSRLDRREAAAAAMVRQELLRLQAVEAGGLGKPKPVAPRAGVQRVVALVGPTGAGKTTTAAKLAAHLYLEQGWKVALITADTFRVGAQEQLGTYARLLGVPMDVAPTPIALERALARLGDYEVVLVDTSGRSHRDTARMADLRAFLAAIPADGPAERAGGREVHLVLPATMRRAEAEAVAAAYRSLGADRLILTKCDECEHMAEALQAVAALGLPLSYFTAGQRVPEDLAVAWPDRLLAWAEKGGWQLGQIGAV